MCPGEAADVDEVSAGAVLHRWVDDAPRYLLLHYPAGHWDFPKGHVEAGETEVEALLREVEEETGIPPDRVEVLDGFREANRYRFRRRGRRRDKVVWYRLARTDVGEVTLSEEHRGWAWFAPVEARERITFDDLRDLFDRAHEEIVQRGPP